MIDYSKYDINKVKKEDILFFYMSEQMNMIEWFHRRPIWHKILFPFYPAPMPRKYYMKVSGNLNEAN